MDPSILLERFTASGARGRLSLPKYLRVCEALVQMLDAGEIRPGDKLPPEIEVARILPISLGTVQKAMATLADQGILERVQGSGTFVADQNTELHDLWHFRFVGDDGEQVLPVYTNAISVESVSEEGPWSRFLGDRQCILITRHIDLNHEFGAIGQFYLSVRRYGELLEEPLHYFDGVHLRDIIYRRFGVLTSHAKVRVSAQSLPDRVCERLKLGPGTAGLVCQIFASDLKGRPLSFQRVYVPPEVQPLEIRESHPLRGAH